MDPENKKRPGGQPGNFNALKHGFYSARFSDLENSDLSEKLSSGLVDEISLLRVLLRRFFHALDDKEELTLDQYNSHISAFAFILSKLAQLLRVDNYLSGASDNTLLTAIDGAIDDFTDILKEVVHD